MQLQDFPGKYVYWSQSWILTEFKLLLRKREIKNKLHGSKICLSKLKLSANCSNTGFPNHREITSVVVLLLHPSATNQHLLMEITKIPAYSPCCAGKTQQFPKLKLKKARLGDRNGHWNDSQERMILKEGCWRKRWVTEIACLLHLPEKQGGGLGMLKWEHYFFFPPVTIRKLTGGKKGAAVVQQLKMRVSHWTNT